MIKVVLSMGLIVTGLVNGCVKAGPSGAAFSTGSGTTADTTVNKDTTATHDSTMNASGVGSYLALGDSYTIGQSVSVGDRYPVQTATMLMQMGDTINAPEIIATTGWTTADLLNALQTHPPQKKTYSRVTLLIGVNNQFQGLPLSQYDTEFTQLLKESITWAGGNPNHVIVLSIPDYGDSFFGQQMSDPAAISAAIDNFNQANQAITQTYGAQYLNITGLTRAAKGDSSLFASDGLHYSGKEMAYWAEGLVKLWPAP
jgi:lysophospholipase L1-like esterase